MNQSRIVRVEFARLEGQRPRKAGSNARLGEHGLTVQVPIARLTTTDGAVGFGACRISADEGATLLGQSLSDLISVENGVADRWAAFEFPLWDLLGQQQGQPVYALTAAEPAESKRLQVPCYDTSLYIDDLHLNSEQEAAALIAAEAREGYERGHRAFKIKVGRGARHQPVQPGTARDIAVIQAVREAVGPEATLMIDANNGYNLNLAKQVLAETADCQLFWLEEAFHEDRILYEDLRDWLGANQLTTLIADGEGDASPRLLEWAKEGIIDVVQYDVFSYGFSRWLKTGRQLDDWGIRSAPHHYGRHLGNYVSGHLAHAVHGFTFIEWDEATTPGLDGSAYQVHEGQVLIPDTPGFGLNLDETIFQAAVKANGFQCTT
jgi:L-alanine-DL-glutamate epimerase-like enolase superfamily enzyme